MSLFDRQRHILAKGSARLVKALLRQGFDDKYIAVKPWSELRHAWATANPKPRAPAFVFRYHECPFCHKTYRPTHRTKDAARESRDLNSYEQWLSGCCGAACWDTHTQEPDDETTDIVSRSRINP